MLGTDRAMEILETQLGGSNDWRIFSAIAETNKGELPNELSNLYIGLIEGYEHYSYEEAMSLLLPFLMYVSVEVAKKNNIY